MIDNDSSLERIGPIVQLQVQRESLKHGDHPQRRYVPDAIMSVPALRLEPEGVWGVMSTGEVPDVHHVDHPRSRNRGNNFVSLSFTAHYDRLRAEFGEVVTNGVGGENILVESDRIISGAALAGGVVVMSDDARIAFADVQIATPCAEFAKFCLGYSADQRPGKAVTHAVQFLDGGIRGFYGTPVQEGTEDLRLAVGDVLYRVVS